MNDEKLLTWRELTEAADALALAIHVGEDDPYAELATLLALHNHGEDRGLHGLTQFHSLRSRQAQDKEWAKAHQDACVHFARRAELVRAEIRERAQSAPADLDDGLAAALRIVSLAEVLGEGPDAVRAAWHELRILACAGGAQVLAA